MAATNFNISGGELRIQDGGSTSETWNEAPGFHRSLFGVRNGLRSVSQTRPICQLRINLYTCKSNEKEWYLLKNPNSLQEGPVSNLQTRCVRADKGRKCVMLDDCYFLSTK